MKLVVLLLLSSFACYIQACRDYNTRCRGWKGYCQKRENKSWMRANCPLTCGYCYRPRNVCMDKNKHCIYWMRRGHCRSRTYKAFMKQNCLKSCGWCPRPKTTKKPTTKKPKTRKPKTQKPVTQKPVTRKPVTQKPKAMECGINNVLEGRIVEGTKAAPYTWVWQVGIKYDNRFVCGGSLISDRHVLTASHCAEFRDELEYFEIIAGDYNRDKKEKTEQIRQVKKVTMHEKYDGLTVENDIAIFELTTPVHFNRTVSPVCISNQPSEKSSTCFITGWGQTAGDGENAIVLQEAKMPLVDNSACAKKNEDSEDSPKVLDTMVCAGYPSANSKVSGCHGDSGGPYVCLNKQTNSWVLEGVVSWGSPECDASEKYTVFARVSKYHQWIRNNLK